MSKVKDYENKNNKYKNINVIHSFKENYMPFLFMFIAIYLISYKNYLCGIITFIAVAFLSYFCHYFSHQTKNIFTILHHYHHENDNFISHYAQIILEISIVGIVVPLYYFFNLNIVNYWIIFFYVMLYSSIHNYNYSILKVNNVHKLHHECINTNYGPDILDITFGTKHPSEINVENINHYGNNIIVSTIIILIIKELFKNECFKTNALFILFGLFILMYIFLFFTSIFVWIDFTRENNKKWYDGII